MVKLTGWGEDENEAWQDAVDSFCIDPGYPDHAELIEDDEEE